MNFNAERAINFSVSATEVGANGAIVAVEGEADLHTAPQLKEALADVIGKGRNALLVDLSSATFIDSTTLGLLTSAVKRLRPVGGELIIACADPSIRKIFEITLLDRFFAIFDTREEGESHLRELEPEPA